MVSVKAVDKVKDKKFLTKGPRHGGGSRRLKS